MKKDPSTLTKAALDYRKKRELEMGMPWDQMPNHIGPKPKPRKKRVPKKQINELNTIRALELSEFESDRAKAREMKAARSKRYSDRMRMRKEKTMEIVNKYKDAMEKGLIISEEEKQILLKITE
jgi:hypothetical protein